LRFKRVGWIVPKLPIKGPGRAPPADCDRGKPA
jgi:hypothetical protein